MSRIFSSAATVRVWIDVEFKLDDEVLHRLDQWSQGQAIHSIGKLSNIWSEPQSGSRSDGGRYNTDACIQPWHVLLAFCQSPYWKRVWIQQEIRYAANVMIHCASTVIEGKDCAEFLRHVLDELYEGDPEEICYWAMFTPPIQVIKNNASLFSAISSTLKGRFPSETLFQTRISLYQALHKAQALEATDLRDTIYGLLPLVNDFVEGKLCISVDYNSSLLQVHTQAARSLIVDYHTLKFLGNIQRMQLSDSECEFPSWVPNWRTTSAYSLTYTDEPLPVQEDEPTDRFNAYLPQISPCDRKLIVQAIKVGRVHHVFEDIKLASTWCPHTPIKAIAPILRRIYEIHDRSLSLQATCGYQRRPQSWVEPGDASNSFRHDIMRAVFGLDRLGYSGIMLTHIHGLLDALKGRIATYCGLDDSFKALPSLKSDTRHEITTYACEFDLHPNAEPRVDGDLELRCVLNSLTDRQESRYCVWTTVRFMSTARRMFLSEQGLMGWVPEGAVIGDEIWFLPGCDTPILLRPAHASSEFTVVGELYVNDYPFWNFSWNTGVAYEQARSSGWTDFENITLV